MITEAIDFKYLLLEQYKKFALTDDDIVTIFMIDHLQSQGTSFITADLLALKMTLDVKSIDKILANLLIKGFIELKTVNNQTTTSLDPLKQKLYYQFQLSLEKENEVNKNINIRESFDRIVDAYKIILKRSLSPVETNKIKDWLSIGYDETMIINALKEAISKGKKTIRSVDKILLSWAEREDLETEGHTLIDENWHKNLEESIRIAKTPWLTDDDDEEK